MIQAQTDRFNTLQNRKTKVGSKPGPGESAPPGVLDTHRRLFSSQRERRLDRSKTRDTERRPSRVSSLRRNPSDPKSASIIRGPSRRQSVDGPDRSPTAERKPSLTRPKPPPRVPLSFKETPEEVQRPRRSRSRPTTDPWAPNARPELSPSSPSLDPPPPASPNPPPSPLPPPLPPKPRIPTEQRSRLGPVEPTTATPGPASSPSSKAPGPKPGAEGARGEGPASADLPRPIRSEPGGVQNRLEGSLEIKLKQGGNKVTAKETPPGAGSGPPGQQGATRTGRVRADGSVCAGPGALGGGVCRAGGRRPQPVQRPGGGRTGASRHPRTLREVLGKPGSTCGVLCFHRGPPGGPPSRPEEPSVRRTATTGGRRTPSD